MEANRETLLKVNDICEKHLNALDTLTTIDVKLLLEEADEGDENAKVLVDVMKILEISGKPIQKAWVATKSVIDSLPTN